MIEHKQGLAPDVQAKVDFARNIVLGEIKEERRKQDEKWGTQLHTMPGWILILTEKLGDVSRCIQELDKEQTETELVKLAAMAVNILEKHELARIRRKEETTQAGEGGSLG